MPNIIKQREKRYAKVAKTLDRIDTNLGKILKSVESINKVMLRTEKQRLQCQRLEIKEKAKRKAHFDKVTKQLNRLKSR